MDPQKRIISDEEANYIIRYKKLCKEFYQAEFDTPKEFELMGQIKECIYVLRYIFKVKGDFDELLYDYYEQNTDKTNIEMFRGYI